MRRSRTVLTPDSLLDLQPKTKDSKNRQRRTPQKPQRGLPFCVSQSMPRGHRRTARPLTREFGPVLFPIPTSDDGRGLARIDLRPRLECTGFLHKLPLSLNGPTLLNLPVQISPINPFPHKRIRLRPKRTAKKKAHKQSRQKTSHQKPPVERMPKYPHPLRPESALIKRFPCQTDETDAHQTGPTLRYKTVFTHNPLDPRENALHGKLIQNR
jgi:hypothetical protein